MPAVTELISCYILESAGKLLNMAMLRPHPRPLKSEFSEMSSFKRYPGDSNVQSWLRLAALDQSCSYFDVYPNNWGSIKMLTDFSSSGGAQDSVLCTASQ